MDRYEKRQNQGQFAGNGVAYFPAQGNDPSCKMPMCNIGKICAVMTNTKLGDEVTRLSHLHRGQSTWIEPKWADTADTTTVASDDKAPPPHLEGDYWGYQTCTEFGFYQTCEVGSKCFFTQGYDTLNASVRSCAKEFGVGEAKLYENIVRPLALPDQQQRCQCVRVLTPVLSG